MDDCWIPLWEWWHFAREMECFTGYSDPAKTESGKVRLQNFIDQVSQKQLSDDVEANRILIQEDRIFCWCVVLSLCNTNLWEKSDAYFSSLSVVGAACGIPIRDPLARYKDRTKLNPRKNRDGTLFFTAGDLDLEVLNANNELIRMCWKTLFTPDERKVNRGSSTSGYTVPYGLRNTVCDEDSFTRMNLSKIPPGMQTFGLGPQASLPPFLQKTGNIITPVFKEEYCGNPAMIAILKTFERHDFDDKSLVQSTLTEAFV